MPRDSSGSFSVEAVVLSSSHSFASQTNKKNTSTRKPKIKLQRMHDARSHCKRCKRSRLQESRICCSSRIAEGELLRTMNDSWLLSFRFTLHHGFSNVFYRRKGSASYPSGNCQNVAHGSILQTSSSRSWWMTTAQEPRTWRGLLERRRKSAASPNGEML